MFLGVTGLAQRQLPGQVSQLTVTDVEGGGRRVVWETDGIIEAPNWTPDGRSLIFNSEGSLWRIGAQAGPPEKIPTGNITRINNDHVLSPDGQVVFIGSGGHLYSVPITGGQPRRISNEHPGLNFRYYLHGISPDGNTLVYVGASSTDGDKTRSRTDIYTLPASGGADIRLTDTVAHDDGPEFSPDGKWIYFNSELNAKTTGHAQIHRMRPDGSGVEQLTRDERVNWFPHVSPDGKWVVYLSYPPGTQGHPPNRDVVLRRMRPDGSEQADVVALFGGQGTINVPSWAPDGRRFAYVAFPVRGK